MAAHGFCPLKRYTFFEPSRNGYSREIESLLYTHPKIADALGIPDEKLGEAIVAWIRLKADQAACEDEIRDYCRGKIAHFKIPQHIRSVESFPMTASECQS